MDAPTETSTKPEVLPLSERIARMHTRAYVDVVVVVCLRSLLVTGTAPAGLEDATWWALVGIGGGNQILAVLGRRGNVTMLALMFAAGALVKLKGLVT